MIKTEPTEPSKSALAKLVDAITPENTHGEVEQSSPGVQNAVTRFDEALEDRRLVEERSPGEKLVRMHLFLTERQLREIDVAWHLRQLPSRAETIRVLLGEALK